MVGHVNGDDDGTHYGVRGIGRKVGGLLGQGVIGLTGNAEFDPNAILS